jgi:phospholipid transport system substrate-binding protein
MDQRGSLRKTATGVGFALALMLGPAQAAPPDATDIVRGFYSTLLQTMRLGPSLGAGGRFGKLAPVVSDTFDMPAMTRLAVGPSWESLDEAQRQRVTAAFARYVAANYADRFDSYGGERLEVTGQQAFGAGVLVKTRIVKSDGEPVAIDYLMRQSGQGWRIEDVYLDGAISELATRRSEFAAILRDQGIAGLIAALDRKSEALSGTGESPS